jgi:CarD family transcriptional regulator
LDVTERKAYYSGADKVVGGNRLCPGTHERREIAFWAQLRIKWLGVVPLLSLLCGSDRMIPNGNFHIGDKVVYPNHGVGVIEQISSRTIGATVEKFYLLKIKSSSLKVMVPFHNVTTVGLRRVVRNGEIQKIVDFLTDGECDNNADWKYRFKENSERMRTGSLLEVAAVLKSLLLLNQSKPLSFREKKMLERARYLLVSELAMAKNCEEIQIEEMLSKALSKAKLRFPEAAEFQA